MKLIILSAFFSFLFGTLFAQDETLDLISKVGTESGKYESMHFLSSKTFVATFEKEIFLMNLSGDILEKGLNPFYKKKLKYNPFLHGGYSAKYDVNCKVNGDQLMFVRNYSSPDREFFELPIPPIKGLMGSIDKYNDPGSSLEGYYSKVSQELFFSAKDQVVIARAYISRCEKTHGNTLPEKEKYNTFVRLVFMDLATKTITEEYILKDVFSIERSKSSYIDFQILKLEDDNIQVGVLESTSKLISPAAHGFSYEGNYTVYAYNIKTKETITVAKQTFKTEPNAVNSILDINKDDFSITWNERSPDGFSLHNKTYHLTENLDFDSSVYHFPAELITLPTPKFYPANEYINLKKERSCVMEVTLVQNKLGKNPVPVYVVMNPLGEVKIIKKIGEYNGTVLSDYKNDRNYNLELEGEEYVTFCEAISEIPVSKEEPKIKLVETAPISRGNEIIRFEDSTFIACQYEIDFAKGNLVKFYFFDFKL